MYLPDTKKGRRQLAGIEKKVRIHQISDELGVTEAWVKKVDRRLTTLEKAKKGEDNRLDLMWQWVQDQWRKEGRKSR